MGDDDHGIVQLCPSNQPGDLRMPLTLSDPGRDREDSQKPAGSNASHTSVKTSDEQEVFGRAVECGAGSLEGPVQSPDGNRTSGGRGRF